ncbi:MAG TPA: hypothetical protein VGD80_13825 [Kofleriaceae bacterium]
MLKGLYHDDEYAAVVRACSSMTVTADIANVCVLGACREHALAKARSWLPAASGSAENLENLVSRCKALGVKL